MVGVHSPMQLVPRTLFWTFHILSGPQPHIEIFVLCLEIGELENEEYDVE
jgi:hypothetical protein